MIFDKEQNRIYTTQELCQIFKLNKSQFDYLRATSFSEGEHYFKHITIYFYTHKAYEIIEQLISLKKLKTNKKKNKIV